MSPKCPYEDCKFELVSNVDRTCPRCGRPVFVAGSIDFTSYIVDKTTFFIGRDWIFRKIDDWLKDEKAPRCFVLTGEPGIGKTAAAARLVEISQGVAPPLEGGERVKQNFLSAYHFCRAHYAETIAPKEFINNTSQQLCAIENYTRHLLVDNGIDLNNTINIQENFGKVIGIRIENLSIKMDTAIPAFVQFLIKPLKEMDKDKDRQPIVLLVDSLDEAWQLDPAETIVRLLSETAGLPPQVRFFLTTRYDRRLIRLLPADAIILLLKASEKTNIQDIRDYILQQIEANPKLREILVQAGIPFHDFVEKIAIASEGNFLYLAWLLPAIASGEHRQYLAEPPKKLEKIYHDTLGTRIHNNNRWRAIYRPIIGVMAVAREPLSATQIELFTHLNRMEVKDALDDLYQFLDPGSARDGKYILYHQSLVEFLGNEEEAQEFWIDLTSMHQMITDFYWQNDPNQWNACDDYGLAHLALHIERTPGNAWRLQNLLFNYDWMQAKLNRLGIYALLADYEHTALFFPDLIESVTTLKKTLQQAASVLATYPDQLPMQLLGRLTDDFHSVTANLLHSILTNLPRPCLVPQSPSLKQVPELIRELVGDVEAFTSVLVTRDGKIISASTAGFVKIWELETGREIRSFQAHPGQINAILLADGDRCLVTASGDHTCKVWDLETCQMVASFTGHTAAVLALAADPEGRQIVSGSDDKTARVWELLTGEERVVFTGHTHAVIALAVMAKDHSVLSAPKQGSVKRWSLSDGHEMACVTKEDDWLHDFVVTPDEEKAIIVGGNPFVRVIRLADGDPLVALDVHLPTVKTAAVSPDGKFLLTGASSISGSDNSVRLWDMQSGRLLHVYDGHRNGVNAIAVTPDGTHIVSASHDATLRLWQFTTDEPGVETISTLWVNGLAPLADGSSVISASGNTLKIWNAGHAAELRTLAVSADEDAFFRCTATTPDFQLVISGSSSGALQTWDIQSGEEQKPFQGHASRVNSVAVTTDGKQVISASADETLKLWDLASRAELATFTGHTGEVYGVALTPDRKYAVSASHDRTIKVWDLAKQRLVHTLSDHQRGVYAIALTLNGYAISASFDHTLKIWDLASRRETATLGGHERRVLGVAVTMDGRRIISAAKDGQLKVWDRHSGACLATFHADGPLRACIVLPGSGLIATGGESGRVHFLRLEE